MPPKANSPGTDLERILQVSMQLPHHFHGHHFMARVTFPDHNALPREVVLIHMPQCNLNWAPTLLVMLKGGLQWIIYDHQPPSTNLSCDNLFQFLKAKTRVH
jgi:hypothetical protein